MKVGQRGGQWYRWNRQGQQPPTFWNVQGGVPLVAAPEVVGTPGQPILLATAALPAGQPTASVPAAVRTSSKDAQLTRADALRTATRLMSAKSLSFGLESRFDSDSSDADLDAALSQLNFVRNPRSVWNMFVVNLVIILNVLVMILQVDYPHLGLPLGCELGRPGCVKLWTPINLSFLVFFTIELSLRLAELGCSEFWCGIRQSDDEEMDEKTAAMAMQANADVPWNIFDFSVVGVGWLDTLVKVLVGDTVGNLSTFIRFFRVLRIMRMVKLVKQLRKLRVIVKGLILSLGIVGWTTLLISMFILLFAILFTTMIGHNTDDWGDEADLMIMYWGSVTSSMLTLFQFLTMDDWGYITRKVTRVQPIQYLFAIVYVVVAGWVFLSLLTGMMAEKTADVRQQEEEEERKQNHNATQESMLSFYEIFEATDNDMDDYLSMEEFTRACASHKIQAMFRKMDMIVGPDEADALFQYLDANDDGHITWYEFRDGMIKLRDVVSKHIPKNMSFMTTDLVKRMQRAEPHSPRGGSRDHNPFDVKEIEDKLRLACDNIETSSAKLSHVSHTVSHLREMASH